MFGGGSTHCQYGRVGVSDDDIIDQGEATYLRSALLKFLKLGGDDAEAKQQGELIASHQWTGIKGFSRDNYPWVGKTEPGVWLCGGYTGRKCGLRLDCNLIADNDLNRWDAKRHTLRTCCRSHGTVSAAIG